MLTLKSPNVRARIRSPSTLNMSVTEVWRKLAIVAVTTSFCMQLTGVDAAYWGSFSQDECAAPGFRKYYARLWDIQGDWMTACSKQPAWIHDTYFPTPRRCVDKGVLGMWGEWGVQDSSCDPNWGKFQDDGCRYGCRQFSSILWDIPDDVSWEFWCYNAWADISGQHFDRPSRCINTASNMWGQFDFRDPVCGNCGSLASPKQLDGARHGDSGGPAGGLPPSSSPSSSPFSDSPSGSPWNR